MKIRCPYCLNEFDNSKARLICRNTLKKCMLEATDEFVSHWRISRDSPMALRPHIYSGGFSLFGAPKLKACPVCGDDIPDYVCPHCHNALPRDMVLNGTDIIPIIGGPGVGKTCYMVALVNQLKRYGWRVNLVSSLDSMYGDAAVKYEEMSNTLFKDKNVLDKTAVRNDSLNMPWFIKIENKVKIKAKKPTYLIFYDIAGEQFASANMMLNQKPLQYASGAIVLLDTFDLPVVKDLLKSLGKRASDVHFSIEKTVEELFNVTGQKMSGTNAEILKGCPIAFAFSKADIITKYRDSLGCFDNTVMGNSLFIENRRYSMPGTFGKNDFAAYINEIDTISQSFEIALRECDQAEMLENNKWNKDDVRYFGVSSLGAEPQADGSLDVEKVIPYRVLDPLVWVLNRLGKIEIV